MNHCILAKYKSEIDDSRKEELAEEINALFQNTTSINGIHSVKIHKNCVSRENRFDIMIIITMDREALEEYDECIWHKKWKEKYANYLDKKAIFDYE